ncbi:unnamed protein product [Ascophyllum nodosum]
MAPSPPSSALQSNKINVRPTFPPQQSRSERLDDDESIIMTKGPDSVVRKLKDRLRAICKRRRIRLQEFFTHFDVHHHKKVSKEQFRRALDQAGLTAPSAGGPPSELLTSKEVDVLIKRYEFKGDGCGDTTCVKYGKLCEQIEKVFTRRGLEKNPTLDVKLSLEDRPELEYGARHPGLSAEEAGVVAGLLSRVRVFVTTAGLDVKTLFETFDKRHSGKVTASVFLRQLDVMFKSRLSKAEARQDDRRLLLRAYQTWDGFANYRAMHVDCGDDVRVAATAVPPPAMAVMMDRLPSQKKETSSPPAGSSLGLFLPVHPLIDLPSLRHRTGATPCHGAVENGHDTNWFVSSATGFPCRHGSDVSLSEGRAWGRGKETKETLEDCWLPIERQMASKVVYHRLRPEDAYAPYDYNRSGTVTEAVFRRGLSDAFRIPFSEDQIDALAEKYKDEKDQVNFLRMCDKICAFAHSQTTVENNFEEEYERKAAARRSPPPPFPLSESLHPPPPFHQNDTEHQIRDTLRTRRLSLRTWFQDFDLRGEGHVSVGQLERVLHSHGILPAACRTLELLQKRYATADDPRHPHGVFIDYRRLLEDLGESRWRTTPDRSLLIGNHRELYLPEGRPTVGAQQSRDDGGGDNIVGPGSGGAGGGTSTGSSQLRVFGKPTGQSRPPRFPLPEVKLTSPVVPRRGRHRGAEELLSHLKAFVFRSSLRTLDFFRSDDPMRRGTMSRERFGRCLLVTGFRFSPTELDVLCDAYPDESLTDDGGAPFVRYVRLLDEVEGVFGVRGLEKKPQCDVDASIKAAKQASFELKPAVANVLPEGPQLSAEEEGLVLETLRELKAEAHRRQLNLYSALQDFDRFNRGIIPGAKFEQALGLAGLLPGRSKTRLLQRKFTERFMSPDETLDVNYRNFLVALDSVSNSPDEIPPDNELRVCANTRGHEAGVCAGGGIGYESEAIPPEQDSATAVGTEDRPGGRGGRGGSGSRFSRPGQTSSLQAVVREVARQLVEGGAEIADFLSDADRLKLGKVSSSKLKGALALAGVSLTDEELSTLENGFESDHSDNMVDWRRLVGAVTKACGDCTTIKEAQGVEVRVNYRQLHLRGQGNIYFPCSADHEPDWQPYPVDPYSAISIYSVDSRPSKTFAPLGQIPPCFGCVQIFLKHQPLHHQSPTVNDIDTSFVVDPPCHGVGYRPVVFSSTKKAVGETPGGGGEGGGREGGEEKYGEGDSVDQEDLVLQRALHTVRQRIKHYRVNLKPSFQDFDPNRRRKITIQRFLSVLGSMNLSLTEREREVICDRYSVRERNPGLRVQYDAFCRDVEPR